MQCIPQPLNLASPCQPSNSQTRSKLTPAKHGGVEPGWRLIGRRLVRQGCDGLQSRRANRDVVYIARASRSVKGDDNMGAQPTQFSGYAGSERRNIGCPPSLDPPG